MEKIITAILSNGKREQQTIYYYQPNVPEQINTLKKNMKSKVKAQGLEVIGWE